MPDNVAITAGAGTSIATDDIGGVNFQRMKLIHGADGVNDGDVSIVNGLPVQGVGELVEAIEALRMTVGTLSRHLSVLTPDTASRLRVVVDAITASLTLATVTTVGTVSSISAGTITTVGTVTNQSQIGGVAANDVVSVLANLRANDLRSNIAVT